MKRKTMPAAWDREREGKPRAADPLHSLLGGQVILDWQANLKGAGMSNLYIVTNNETGTQRIISAPTRAAAIRHVAEDTLEAKLAGQVDLYGLAKAGVVIEDAEALRAAEGAQAAARG